MPRKRLPWLMFVTPDVDGGSSTPPAAAGGTTPPEKTDEEFLAEFGFPRNTATDKMTAEQQAAYWRNMAKNKQTEAKAYAALGKTPDEIRQILADAEAARAAALTDSERALETVRTEATTAGMAAGRDKYLTPAIEGQVLGLTIRPGEDIEAARTRVQGALKFIDVTKFVDENGDLDADAIQTFAQSIGSTDSDGTAGGSDPLFTAMQRQHATPPGSSGSVDQYEADAYERLSKKKK